LNGGAENSLSGTIQRKNSLSVREDILYDSGRGYSLRQWKENLPYSTYSETLAIVV